jgi:hypothetical protein
MIFATIYALNNLWGKVENWISTLYIYYIIVAISGVTLALWIGIDGKRLQRYAKKMVNLEKKLIDLDQKIRIIKHRNKEKESNQ